VKEREEGMRERERERERETILIYHSLNLAQTSRGGALHQMPVCGVECSSSGTPVDVEGVCTGDV
jgi:hypothetical protein